MINLNATLLVQLVNFLLLMFLLDRLLFRPMVRVLEERKERTEGRRKKAAQADAEAESVWATYQKRIQDAKTAADRLRADVARQAEAERQRLVDAATGEAEKAVTTVRARVKAEAAEARKVLEADARRLAADAAHRILGRSV
ncbi:MAG: F0F1 ATP synthase subunit B family protein [Deferrisomatales bacterium]